jgi:DNA-binding FadR family transcriptional regulator
VNIFKDHEQLVDAIEKKDEDAAYEISRHHLRRYHENLEAMKKAFPDYFGHS